MSPTALAGQLVATQLHPNVIDWYHRVIRVSSAPYAIPALKTMNAMNYFYNGLVQTGLLPKMYSVICMCPEANSFNVLNVPCTPLINSGSISSYIGVGSWVTSDLTIDGLRGDGSSKYLRTSIALTAPQIIDTSSIGVSVYVSFINPATGKYDLGYYNSAGTDMFNFRSGYINRPDASGYTCYSLFVDNVGITGSCGAGFYSGNRISTTDLRLYFGNSTHSFAQTGSTLTTAMTSTASAHEIYVYCANGNVPASGSGTTIGFNDYRYSFVGFHQGLNSTEATTLYNLVTGFRQRIGGGFV